MNPWPFVIAAYALTFLGVAGVSIWSWRAASGAEARADSLRRERD
ncbi:MAG: heme exporter protein CcmD [Sphingobium sp.]